jgi:transposase
MSKRPRPDPKREALRRRGALNPHPERVRDPLFTKDDLFDPRDLLQVKYEMIRRARTEELTVSEACRCFGLSRAVFYRCEAELHRDGLPGLLAKKRGPRGGHKLTEQIMKLLDRLREEDPSRGSDELARLLTERRGLKVHPRSIERALARREKKP